MTRKCLLLICLLACPAVGARAQNKELRASRVRNRSVAYAPAARVRRFPFPVVNFEREGLARRGDERAIMDGIVYPLVNRSRRPIAAIVVTFYPDAPHITVQALWHGTDFKGILIERDARGHFPADAYKVFFDEDAARP